VLCIGLQGTLKVRTDWNAVAFDALTKFGPPFPKPLWLHYWHSVSNTHFKNTKGAVKKQNIIKKSNLACKAIIDTYILDMLEQDLDDVESRATCHNEA